MVKEDKRGNKIGEALFNKTVEVAKKHDLQILELDAHMKLQSYGWYKRLGFNDSGWVHLIKNLV